MQETWSEITKEECSTLVESKPRRIEAVIALSASIQNIEDIGLNCANTCF